MNLGAPHVEVFYSSRTAGHLRFVEFVRDVLDRRFEEVNLTVSDVAADPERAEERGVVATPQVVRWYPTPVRRIIGEFYEEETLLSNLETDQHLIDLDEDSL